MFHAPLIIMSRKYFFDFRSSLLPFDIRFWTRGFPLEMRSWKPGLPFATRARKRELSIQEVRIENDSDRKFSKSKFFKVFLKTTFLHDPCYPDHFEPKIYFFELVKNENFEYVIIENCPICITKMVKNENFDYVINDQTPPPPPRNQP